MSTGEAGNRRAWRVQWPITRTPKPEPEIQSYDPRIIEWLGQLAGDGNEDNRLTIQEFSHRINQADRYRKLWQHTYYVGRGTVIIVAAAVTALASASAGISGTAGLVIKIATAVLSFVVAATTGVLELLQVNNRWALYRILRNKLWRAAWQLTTDDTSSASEKFEVLNRKLGKALNDFERQYLTQVLIVGPDNTTGEEPEARDQHVRPSGLGQHRPRSPAELWAAAGTPTPNAADSCANTAALTSARFSSRSTHSTPRC